MHKIDNKLKLQDRQQRAPLSIILLGLLLLSVSCPATKQNPGTTGTPEKTTSRRQTPLKKARAELSQRDTTIHQLEEQNDWQNLSLLEKDALIKEMEQRLVAQQLLLDDAIQEVVRVKAKQRSLESRAEAASEMAEAEIALKSLREQAATEVHDLELSKAEQLLKMAAKEFENENFGGTLYLIDRAKGQIKVGTLRVGERDHIEGLEGEVPFAVPLSLLVSIRSNLREGPGTQFKVLVTLDQGASITGYSSKGAWVRVQSHEGWIGWIHLSLVSSS